MVRVPKVLESQIEDSEKSSLKPGRCSGRNSPLHIFIYEKNRKPQARKGIEFNQLISQIKNLVSPIPARARESVKEQERRLLRFDRRRSTLSRVRKSILHPQWDNSTKYHVRCNEPAGDRRISEESTRHSGVNENDTTRLLEDKARLGIYRIVDIGVGVALGCK